jgi:serine/threonine protein kinase
MWIQWCGVIDGLAYLHSRQVVHGDLKPVSIFLVDDTRVFESKQSNIMIDDQGTARTCDFGLVRILSDETHGKLATTTYTGTPRYLAYELVIVERPIPTLASDIYALGCVALDVRGHNTEFKIHECLTCLIVYLSPASSCKL